MKTWTPEDFKDNQGEIEGLIFRVASSWVAVFENPAGGDNIRVAINYCPFCGREIRGVSEHKC